MSIPRFGVVFSRFQHNACSGPPIERLLPPHLLQHVPNIKDSESSQIHPKNPEKEAKLDLQKDLSRYDLLHAFRTHDAGQAWQVYKRLVQFNRHMKLEDHSQMLNMTTGLRIPVLAARHASKIIWNIDAMNRNSATSSKRAGNAADNTSATSPDTTYFMDTRDFNNAMLIHLKNDDAGRVYETFKTMSKLSDVLFQQNKPLEATSCLPNARSYTLLIASFVSADDLAAALDIYHHVIQKQHWSAFEVDPDVVAILLNALGKAGRFSDAEALYEQVNKLRCNRDVQNVVATVRQDRMIREAMIRVYGYHGQIKNAKALFDNMKDDPSSNSSIVKLPDLDSYDAMMEAYASNHLRDDAEDLWAELLDRLQDYSSSDTNASAENQFRSGDETIPHRTTFTHLIAVRAADNDVDAVASLFDQLVECHTPNLDAYQLVVQAHIRASMYEKAVAYYDKMVKRGFTPPFLMRAAIEKLRPQLRMEHRRIGTAAHRNQVFA